MLTLRSLGATIEEAERFLRIAKDLERTFIEAEVAVSCEPDDETPLLAWPAKSGAVKRASMDLTRSLARMRARASRRG